MKSENQKKRIPKQIFYVWNYLEWGGAQMYFLGIARRIKDRTNVKFIFPRETDEQFIGFCQKAGIEYEFIDTPADLKSAPNLKRKIQRHWRKIQSERSLLQYLKKYEFEDSILHIELAPWQSVLSLIFLCKRANVFLTMHNALPKVTKWRRLLWKLKFSQMIKLPNFRIFVSNNDARISLKPFVTDDFLENVPVTYTNVNPEEIEDALGFPTDRGDYLRKFGLPEDKFLVFCLGQFIDRKGRWVFLEAAQKILKTEQEIIFVWITNSNLSAEDEAKIETYGLQNEFFLLKSEFVGADHSDLMKFLKLAGVFTLPSFVEGLPISLLEAMALGVPCVSTEIYAIPEAVIDGETGILIEAGNSDALAEAILKLKKDEILRRNLAENGRKFVLENFNEKFVAEIAFENYCKALEK